MRSSPGVMVFRGLRLAFTIWCLSGLSVHGAPEMLIESFDVVGDGTGAADIYMVSQNTDYWVKDPMGRQTLILSASDQNAVILKLDHTLNVTWAVNYKLEYQVSWLFFYGCVYHKGVLYAVGKIEGSGTFEGTQLATDYQQIITAYNATNGNLLWHDIDPTNTPDGVNDQFTGYEVAMLDGKVLVLGRSGRDGFANAPFRYLNFRIYETNGTKVQFVNSTGGSVDEFYFSPCDYSTNPDTTVCDHTNFISFPFLKVFNGTEIYVMSYLTMNRTYQSYKPIVMRFDFVDGTLNFTWKYEDFFDYVDPTTLSPTATRDITGYYMAPAESVVAVGFRGPCSILSFSFNDLYSCPHQILLSRANGTFTGNYLPNTQQQIFKSQYGQPAAYQLSNGTWFTAGNSGQSQARVFYAKYTPSASVDEQTTEFYPTGCDLALGDPKNAKIDVTTADTTLQWYTTGTAGSDDAGTLIKYEYGNAGECVQIPRYTVTDSPITVAPSNSPATGAPSSSPVTGSPSVSPTTVSPSATPTSAPTEAPVTATPTTAAPSNSPATGAPSSSPVTGSPSVSPTTVSPSATPTTQTPTTLAPTASPTTMVPTASPTTMVPTASPTTMAPTGSPTSVSPTSSPKTASQEGTGTIIGIVVGVFFALAAAAVVWYKCCKKENAQQNAAPIVGQSLASVNMANMNAGDGMGGVNRI